MTIYLQTCVGGFRLNDRDGQDQLGLNSKISLNMSMVIHKGKCFEFGTS